GRLGRIEAPPVSVLKSDVAGVGDSVLHQHELLIYQNELREFFSKLRDASRLKLVQDQLLPVGRGNDVDIVYCPVPTTLAGPNRVRELAQEHEAAHRAARLEGICARAGTEVELHCAVTLVPGGGPHPVGKAPREGV